LEQVRSQMSAESAAELLPVDSSTFTSHFAADNKERRKEARELQRAITSAIRTQQEEAQRAEAKSSHDKALLNCCRAQGAALAFTTTPYARHLAMNDKQVACNERLHMGLPPEPRMPLHCACNAPNGQYASDAWHGLSCQSERGTSVTDRHDDVKLALARWASRLGATRVKSEPRRLERNSKRRPDLLIEIAGQCYLIDVTIRHPLAPSHVDDCARDEEKILESAEAEKHREYRVMAEEMGATFVAFAAETTGRLGKDALAFIKTLIQEGARFKNVWAPRKIVQGIYRTVAVAIARGNTEIINSNLRRSRIAAWE
jgi:hypothetical protein